MSPDPSHKKKRDWRTWSLVNSVFSAIGIIVVLVAIILLTTQAQSSELKRQASYPTHEPLPPYAALAQAAPSRITIGQAILIAERETGGEAIEAELDEEDGELIYEVDVLKGQSEFEVTINPQTGDILSIEKDD